jgi:hypothetical protein
MKPKSLILVYQHNTVAKCSGRGRSSSELRLPILIRNHSFLFGRNQKRVRACQPQAQLQMHVRSLWNAFDSQLFLHRVKDILRRCTFVGSVCLIQEFAVNMATACERFLESIAHRESYIR